MSIRTDLADPSTALQVNGHRAYPAGSEHPAMAPTTSEREHDRPIAGGPEKETRPPEVTPDA